MIVRLALLSTAIVLVAVGLALGVGLAVDRTLATRRGSQ